MHNRYDYAFRKEIKLCEVCSSPLKLINSRDLKRKRFCSPACKFKDQLGRATAPKTFRDARICKRCSIEYIAIVPKQEYCSRRCCSQVLSRRSLARNNNLQSHIRRLLRYKGRKDLTLDFITGMYEKQKGLCAFSGIQMTWDTLNGRVGTNLSIDRISSYIGYTTDNIQLVCRIVNIMKNNLGQSEFVDLCHKIGGYKNSK